MGLYSKDVIVTPSSTADLKTSVIPNAKSWINALDEAGNDSFFARVFDARDKTLVYIFSIGCMNAPYNMTEEQLVVYINDPQSDNTNEIVSESAYIIN